MAAVNLRFLLLVSKLCMTIYLWQRGKKKHKKRHFWIRKFYNERKLKGKYNTHFKDLKLYDHEIIFRYFRTSPSTFEKLLKIVAPDITKTETKMCESVCAQERLAITIRYLATEDADTTIAANYRMSPTTVGRIVYETCAAIWNNLALEYVKAPNSQTEWKNNAHEFETRWHFPHCIRAIDGKHVQMFAPARSGSSYFRCKKTQSVVLMAVSDAKYCFILVDIGDGGRQSDGSVYNNSQLGFAIENNLLKIPEDSKIVNNCDKILPYVFVADDAFGLKRHMMKPYAFKNLSIDKLVFTIDLVGCEELLKMHLVLLQADFVFFTN